MVPNSLRRKYTNKQALTCRRGQSEHHLLPRIMLVHRCTPRRNLGVVLALIRIQRKSLTPGPNLLRGRTRTIIRRATPTLFVPQNPCHLRGVPTRETKWIWMSQLESRNLTRPPANTSIYPHHPIRSSRCHPRLSRFNNSKWNHNPPPPSPQGLARTCGLKKIRI